MKFIKMVVEEDLSFKKRKCYVQHDNQALHTFARGPEWQKDKLSTFLVLKGDF